MLKITNDNYQYYKNIYQIIWEFQAYLMNIDHDYEFSPIKVLESWEKIDESKARRGLKISLTDILTGIKDLPNNLLSELNHKLVSKDFPKIEILTSEIRNIPEKILATGKIKNAEQYYILKEVLDDTSYLISEEERRELTNIFSHFEKNFKG